MIWERMLIDITTKMKRQQSLDFFVKRQKVKKVLEEQTGKQGNLNAHSQGQIFICMLYVFSRG
jgi:hypothetical protein